MGGISNRMAPNGISKKAFLGALTAARPENILQTLGRQYEAFSISGGWRQLAAGAALGPCDRI